MIGTRTARAALLGLIGLLFGLAVPAIAAARPVSQAAGSSVTGSPSTPPSMLAPVLDTRAPDQANTTVRARVGEFEVWGSQAPVVGFVPSGERDRLAAMFVIVVVVSSTVVLTTSSPTPARAPPLAS